MLLTNYLYCDPETLNYELTRLDDTKVTFQSILESHKGKTVLIEIWASWCGDCVKAMPKLKEIQGNNSSVDYVFISMDKFSEKWKNGIINHDIKGDHYWVNDIKMMKGDFGKSLDVDWIPRYIVINKKGEITLYKN